MSQNVLPMSWEGSSDIEELKVPSDASKVLTELRGLSHQNNNYKKERPDGGTCYHLLSPDSAINPDLEALMDTIDWNEEPDPPAFFCLPTTYLQLVESSAAKNGCHLPENLFLDQRFFTRPPHKRAEAYLQHLKAPEGFIFTEVEPKWAQAIDAVWDYQNPPHTEIMIHNLLKHKLGIGVLEEKTGDLVAWFLLQEYGIQGLLHVVSEHRGKGLASFLLARMHQLTAKLGCYEVVVILDDNEASYRLFRKLGMEPGEAVAWVFPLRSE